MNKYSDYIGKFLLIAGVAEIAVGISHFAMPYFAYQSIGYSSLNYDEINFVTLCIFAVGILLIAFGILTVFFSLKKESAKGMLFYYCIIKSLLWLARIILEIIYPVKINLFYIEKPTMIILPLLFLVWLLFTLPAVFFMLSNRKKTV
jgi:hypothetical protein